MADGYVGEIRLFGFQYAPEDWAFCDGRLLPVSQYQTLFAVLGTTYGGDGVNTFRLPNLSGRVPVGVGTGTNLPAVALAQLGGEETHVLTTAELPAHTHAVNATTNPATLPSPTSAFWATNTPKSYSATATKGTFMDESALTYAGENQDHPNMQPYVVLNYCICVQGLFPPQN